jgi:hypothetical protein
MTLVFGMPHPPDDYDDRDGHDDNCTSDDDSEAETDDSYTGGLPEDCTHGTSYPMSTPISKEGA